MASEDAKSAESTLRPPLLLELSLEALEKFTRGFDKYALLGGTRKLPTLLAPHVLSYVTDAVPGFVAKSPEEQKRAIYGLVNPTSVHTILDKLAAIRMSSKSLAVDINDLARYIAEYHSVLTTALERPDEGFIIELFTNSLYPPRLRDRVRYAKTTVLKDTIAVSRREAAVLLQCQQETSLLGYERAPPTRRSGPRPPAPPHAQGAASAGQTPQSPPSARSDNSKSSPSPRRPPVCFNCKEVGLSR
jgi:hypothetical protein